MNIGGRREALASLSLVLLATAYATESLDVQVPSDPTAFPSAGRTHLYYELIVKNASRDPSSLERIEVVDPEAPDNVPIAVFEGARLETMLRSAGREPPPARPLEIAAGNDVLVFVAVTLDGQTRVPDQLLNRVIVGNREAGVAVIETHHTPLLEIGPPVQGADWLAADAPSNDVSNHHRRGTFDVDGRPVISRRYAIDWLQVDDSGSRFSGDPAEASSYYAYGADVLAVADGRVVTARDGIPDNVPRHNGIFQPAIALTMDTVPGNTVTISLGKGQYAYYLHMQRGSVQVKAGDAVRRGQVIGRIGNSGDAREPHLHFEVTTGGQFATSEGVPYVIDRYTITGGSSARDRSHELPLDDMIIDFGERAIP